MRIGEGCVDCIYNRELRRTQDPAYLQKVREVLSDWDPKISAPYFEYITNNMYREWFGEIESYAALKKSYNDLVLGAEAEIREKLNASDDPMKTSFFMSRIGNFIDFAAMSTVDRDDFLKRLFDFQISPEDEVAYAAFYEALKSARRFLLLADNSGEIVLDRMFLEEMKKTFPGLEIVVMIRGAEVSNDATIEDALQAGIDRVAEIVSSGIPVAGIIPDMISEEAKNALDCADVILSKGQGNYEAMSNQGYHVFYSFLCKCDMFVKHFGVPRFTGMIVEEK